jgi:outer membrane protein
MRELRLSTSRGRGWRAQLRGALLASAVAAGLAVPLAPARGAALPDSLRLTLRDCTERALQYGEEMQIAAANLRSAHGAYVQARSDVFPQLNFNSGYTHQFESVYRSADSFSFKPFAPDTLAPIEDRVRDLEKNLPTAPLASFAGIFSSGPFGSVHRWDASLGATQKVFEGGSVWAAVKVARHALGSFESRYEDRKVEVTLQVREAYLGAALADRAVAIARLGLQQADTQLQRVRSRQEAGEASEYDLLQGEVQRDNQMPVVKRAENARDVAYLHLARIANLPLGVPLVLTTPLLGDLPLPPDPMAVVDTTGLEAAALRASGITAIAEEVDARRDAVTVSGASAWPALSLFANYSEQAYPSDFWPQRGAWYKDVNAGARLSWTFFDGFRTKGAKTQAQAMVTITEQNLELAREELLIAIHQDLGELNRAAADLHARTRTVGLARRALDLATLRYDEGASSLLEVEDARTAYQVALVSESTARHDYFAALARLERYSERPLFTDLVRQLGAD